MIRLEINFISRKFNLERNSFAIKKTINICSKNEISDPHYSQIYHDIINFLKVMWNLIGRKYVKFRIILTWKYRNKNVHLFRLYPTWYSTSDEVHLQSELVHLNELADSLYSISFSVSSFNEYYIVRITLSNRVCPCVTSDK